MQPESDIAALCRSHLEGLPGIRKATIRAPVRFPHLPSADLSLVLDTDIGQFSYVGAERRRLTPSKLDHWLLLTLPRRQRRWVKAKPILLADYISPGNAERLREAEVDYVDAAGNLLIRRPRKLYLFKSGAKPLRLVEPRQGRLFMPSGLRVLFVLLVEPAAADMPYRELALHSRVALGSVAVIMNELKGKGYLVRGRNRSRLVRRRELLDRWVSGYGEQLRQKLLLGVFSAPGRDAAASLERLREVLRDRQIDSAVTGGFAAYEWTHHYRGDELTVFVSQWPKGTLQQLRWLPSPKGSITLLRQFCPAVVWAPGGEPHVAHPLLVYAELLYLGRERERETARMIYDQHLEQLAADDAD